MKSEWVDIFVEAWKIRWIGRASLATATVVGLGAVWFWRRIPDALRWEVWVFPLLISLGIFIVVPVVLLFIQITIQTPSVLREVAENREKWRDVFHSLPRESQILLAVIESERLQAVTLPIEIDTEHLVESGIVLQPEITTDGFKRVSLSEEVANLFENFGADTIDPALYPLESDSDAIRIRAVISEIKSERGTNAKDAHRADS